MNKKEQMIARMREIGGRGGKATVAKHGTDYMRKIASRGGKKTQQTWESEDDVTDTTEE